VAGVRKGKVNDLRLTQDGVLVQLQIYRDVVLKSDATFTIKNLGLMGERFVAISPGRDSTVYNDSVTAEGRYDSGIPEVMGLMGEMVKELRQVVASLRQSIASDSSLDKFNKTVSNLESVSSSLASYMDNNRSKFDKTADNFLGASRKLNQMLQRNASVIDSSAGRIDRIGVKLEAFVDQLDTLATTARSFADRIENEEGTLQMLVEDRRLYDDLRRTADNLDDLITDIRADPGKYINLKVELF
jgi:phospholipid/cholesterol/gamma-HCH transport system substrate-binding protein